MSASLEQTAQGDSERPHSAQANKGMDYEADLLRFEQGKLAKDTQATANEASTPAKGFSQEKRARDREVKGTGTNIKAAQTRLPAVQAAAAFWEDVPGKQIGNVYLLNKADSKLRFSGQTSSRSRWTARVHSSGYRSARCGT